MPQPVFVWRAARRVAAVSGALTPRGRQGEVVWLPPDRDVVVLGTAGTGKSHMALMRADFLGNTLCENYGPVLLVTYTNTLVTYLRHLRAGGFGNVTIETYHLFARGYLASVGKMESSSVVEGYRRSALVVGAVLAAAKAYDPTPRFFQRDPDFFIDELDWIAGMGLDTLEKYLGSDRIGRGRSLTERQRRAVWRIRECYLQARAKSGFEYDWYDLPTTVRAELAADTRPRKYRHVVIDEGQDFSPEAIRSLVDLVGDDGTVSFFGDYHQQIYGQGLSFRACGLDVSSITRFADNYRNTAEISRVAIAMSAMAHMAGQVDDLVVPVEPKAAGPKPTLVRCSGAAVQVIQVQKLAREQVAQGARVAVLARTWAETKRASAGLNVRMLRRNMRKWDVTPGVYCGAYHSAKGLEFDTVLMPFCEEASVPKPSVVAAFGDDQANAREGRLLYVAVTRARENLVVLHTDRPSPLLPLDADLWTRVQR